MLLYFPPYQGVAEGFGPFFYQVGVVTEQSQYLFLVRGSGFQAVGKALVLCD